MRTQESGASDALENLTAYDAKKSFAAPGTDVTVSCMPVAEPGVTISRLVSLTLLRCRLLAFHLL